MDINFDRAIENGASEQELLEAMYSALEKQRAEYEAQIHAAAEKHTEKKEKDKEALKAEARAYAINALLAYTEAFDLLPEGETMNDEDAAKLEQLLIKVENMIPLYIKIIKMQEDMDKDLGFGFGLAGGLF